MNDRGVSPVIGVVLMVAIAVILAAVVATFVLGFPNDVSESPQATFTFDYDSNANTLTVTHNGGEDIDVSNINVKNCNNVAYSNSELSAGDTIECEPTGDSVSIVWENNGESSIIGTWEN